MKAIDLDEAIERFTQAGANMSKDQVIYMLNRIPTTEIVRCKDCKWWGRKTTYKDGTIITDCKRGLMANENGFCSFGERKE